MTGRAGELVEALAERKVDVACVRRLGEVVGVAVWCYRQKV